MSDEMPEPPSFSGPSTRLLSIREPDLAELERILPEVFDRLIFSTIPDDQADGETIKTANRLRTEFRNVQQIIVNVRWNYGPPSEIGILRG